MKAHRAVMCGGLVPELGRERCGNTSRRPRTYIFIEKRDESRSVYVLRDSARAGELLVRALGEITSGRNRRGVIASSDFEPLNRPKFAHHGPKSLPCHSEACWERACSVAGQRRQ